MAVNTGEFTGRSPKDPKRDHPSTGPARDKEIRTNAEHPETTLSGDGTTSRMVANADTAADADPDRSLPVGLVDAGQQDASDADDAALQGEPEPDRPPPDGLAGTGVRSSDATKQVLSWNIRGLYPQKDKSKLDFLRDYAVIHEPYIIS